MSGSDRRIAVGLFILTFVTYAWFFGGGGWNQNAHFDLARALVERQTLHVDGYRVNSGDIAWSNVSGEWHAYINKAPGLSFLAAVPYAALYAVERAAGKPVDSWLWMTVNAWLLTALTCGVCGALIAVVMYRQASLPVALTVAFGTIVLPYSTMLVAHVPAALFLLLAYVWREERPFAAGLSAGMAGACFYLCIPAAIVLVFGKRAGRFIAGGLPFALLLGLYQWACFGSPFRTAVEASVNFTEKGLWLGVFRVPSLEALWGLTFSEYRGLFFVSPFLLLAFFGQRRWRIFAVAAVFLVAVAGFNGWEGGHAFGPRYLLPAVPLLASGIRNRRWLPWLGAVSAAMQLMATAINPMPDAAIRRPVRDFYLVTPATSVNTQAIDELLPGQQHAPGSRESEWASFNLGELLFGAGNPWSVAPVVLWMIAGSLVLRRWSQRQPSP